MGMILLDTNAAIYYLQGDKKSISVIDELRTQEQHIGISVISEMEILSFPNLDGIQIIKISEWLRTLVLISVDSRIAREAAKFRRIYRIKTPDALIASTAFVYGARVVTRDKDFKKITQLEVVSI